MENLDSKWHKFLKNLVLYLVTLFVLMLLTRFLRTFPMMIILWLVGLSWGTALAYRFSRLLFDEPESVIDEGQLQNYLEQAIAYQMQIDQAIQAASGKQRPPHLAHLARQIHTWTDAIDDLVQRLNTLRQNKIIRRDIAAVPKAIADLEKRLAAESDPAIKSQLKRTLTNRKKQLASLQALQNTIKRAEIQIENTLSMLGTIYSQILTGQSTSQVADYSRLAADVDEEVHLLQDHLEALREVKLGEEK